jgi:hypothetical protein
MEQEKDSKMLAVKIRVMEKEMMIRVMQLLAKGCHSHQKLEKAEGRFPPQPATGT